MRFADVTREHFEAFSELCRRNDAGFESKTGTTVYPGIEVRTDEGAAGHNGFELAWTYDEELQQLDVNCVKSIFMFPVEVVHQGIGEMVEQSRPVDPVPVEAAEPKPPVDQNPPVDITAGTETSGSEHAPEGTAPTTSATE